MNLKKTYIIAEVGPNHQGSLKIAKDYIKKLSDIGVDAVKFQIGIACMEKKDFLNINLYYLMEHLEIYSKKYLK